MWEGRVEFEVLHGGVLAGSGEQNKGKQSALGKTEENRQMKNSLTIIP